MHELGIATDLLMMVEEQAERSGMGTVRRVCVELGVLAPIDLEALDLAFEIARAGVLPVRPSWWSAGSRPRPPVGTVGPGARRKVRSTYARPAMAHA